MPPFPYFPNCAKCADYIYLEMEDHSLATSSLNSRPSPSLILADHTNEKTRLKVLDIDLRGPPHGIRTVPC